MQPDTTTHPGEAPPGTVTFLFTDVEGSTQLLRRLGARGYAAVLAEHDQLLRNAIASGGGEVVDTQGDAMFAAFPDVAGAVAAAVAAQRSLTERVWPDGASVRVRMGLHTGVPEVAGARYLGLDVHLAARICAAAHGGQTVVSDAVCDHLGAAPAGFAIRPLGDHHLKDFELPVQLFQVDPDGVSREFPALHSEAASGDVGRFEGREEELAEAAAAAIARAARRSERRRLLAAFAGVALIAAAVALFLATRPTPVHVTPDSVAVIDAQSGKVEADVPVGPAPTAVTSGAGAVWVLDTSKDTVTRIDPRTDRAQTQGVGSLTSRPTDVAVSDGEVWVVNGFDRTAAVLNATTEALVQTVPLSRRLGVLGLGDAHAATGERGVWIANGGTGGVSEFDPHTNNLVTTVPGASGQIATGYGSVWLVAGYGLFGFTGQISRIDQSSGHVVERIRVGEADAIAAGSGAVWVADAATRTVRRIDPATNRVTAAIPVASGADVLAAGGGYVWAAGSSGMLSRIDPTTDLVDKQIRFGVVRPVSLTVYHGAVYVGVEPPLAPPAGGGGLRVVAPPEAIDSVDPAFAFQASSWQILYATDLNLVTYPDEAGTAGTHLVPDAAAAMPRVSNHGRTYTFVVRRGYQFSPPSNKPVTAADFRAAIERDLRIGTASEAAPFADVVAGAGAFQAGKTEHPSGVAVQGQTISITSDADPGALLAELALPMFAAVPPDTPITTHGTSTVPSAGPYYVRSYIPNRQLVLAKNPNYRGRRRAVLDRISYQESPHATWQEVIAGRADYGVFLPSPPAALIPRYGPESPPARAGRQQLFVDPVTGPSVSFFALNTHRPLFRSALARRAVNDAIDRPALAASSGPAGGLITDQYLPASIIGAVGSGSIYPLDHPHLGLARRLMRRSGVHLPATATLYTCTSPQCAARARILVTDLRPLRIHLHVRAFPRSTQIGLDVTPGTPFDIADEGFTYAVNDPSFFYTLADFAYLNTGPYTAAIAHADSLPTAAHDAALLHISSELTRNYAPLAAYAIPNQLDPFSARIGCQVYQPVFGIDLTRLCLR